MEVEFQLGGLWQLFLRLSPVRFETFGRPAFFLEGEVFQGEEKEYQAPKRQPPKRLAGLHFENKVHAGGCRPPHQARRKGDKPRGSKCGGEYSGSG
ncbi:MAG: hypothetical protein QF787_00350 [Nitrospinota bacterium]|nr:hypothetical protein [Nitrospinota bacterium]